MNSDIPNLSRRVSPAGNVNIAGREMLDSLCISTQITTRNVEWKKQWLQARYKDEDLFYALHGIQGQPSLEEFWDFIKQYEADMTNELTKSRIDLESKSRFIQSLPYTYPNRNAYVDELKNQNDKLTLQNDQFRRKEAQHSTEIDQLKGREAQLSAEIDRLRRNEAHHFEEKNHLADENGNLKNENGNLKNENGNLKNENGNLKNENGNLKNKNAKLSEKIDKMMTGMMQMFFKWQMEL